MIQFTKNIGQFHHRIAYVAPVPTELRDEYRGCGLVELKIEGVKITGWHYLEHDDHGVHPELDAYWDQGQSVSPALADSLRPGKVHGMLSCYELCIDRGTAAAALLNLTAQGENA